MGIHSRETSDRLTAASNQNNISSCRQLLRRIGVERITTNNTQCYRCTWTSVHVYILSSTRNLGELNSAALPARRQVLPTSHNTDLSLLPLLSTFTFSGSIMDDTSYYYDTSMRLLQDEEEVPPPKWQLIFMSH